jgi:hypothetical protein
MIARIKHCFVSREKMIEEERINILQQHAQNLLGYLPRGLIKDSDIGKLGSDFKTALSSYGAKKDSCA